VKVGFGRKFKSLDMEFLPYETVWELVKGTKPVPSEPSGSGIAVDPWRPANIGEWFWLAQVDIGAGPQFVQVGKRLIVRWGTDAGGMKNYSSDITDNLEVLQMTDTPTDKGVKKAQVVAGEHIKKVMEESDKRAGLKTTGTTVYTRKAQRVQELDPMVLAGAIRSLLRGRSTSSACDGELANSLCGLLICEGHKSRDNSGCAVFMTTLLLLDLIEAGIKYGHKGQQYTWASLLMHGSESADRDPVKTPEQILGRSVTNKAREVAKHPMAGLGTVNLGKSITNLKDDNTSRNRVVSVGVAWLANFLWERDPSSDYAYFFVKQDSKTWEKDTAVKQKPYGHLKDVCKSALTIRSITTDCLINGKRSRDVGYVDPNGKPI
jgi:hypothetical protein